MDAQKNHLNETVLLSTHNIRYGWEIRKKQANKVWKMKFRQEKIFSDVSFNDEFKFGSNIITNGRRFFCFPFENFECDYYGCNQTWRLLSGVFEDFDKCVELSQQFSFKTEGFTLVILPDYPQFKCVNHTLC